MRHLRRAVYPRWSEHADYLPAMPTRAAAMQTVRHHVPAGAQRTTILQSHMHGDYKVRRPQTTRIKARRDSMRDLRDAAPHAVARSATCPDVFQAVRQRVDGAKLQETQNENNMTIRHSALPKLALCGQYVGASGTSEAAARGNRLDALFRHAWERGDFLERDIPEEDVEAVQWAVTQCHRLEGGVYGLTTAEEACKIKTPGLEHIGTVDGIAWRGGWSVDLKSGQMYDYAAQMAAYAMGAMTMAMDSEWTTHLLFCDQRQVVTHHWTYESAKALVDSVLANVGTAPRENDYCGWCAKSLTCGARIKSMTGALVPAQTAVTPDNDGFLALLNDPVRLGRFLAQCSTLDDFRDAAKAKARELLEAGYTVPGWRLQKARVTEYVEAEHIAQAVRNGAIGADDAILAGGSLSAKKAEALWNAAGAVMPDEIVARKIGQQPLVQAK